MSIIYLFSRFGVGLTGALDFGLLSLLGMNIVRVLVPAISKMLLNFIIFHDDGFVLLAPDARSLAFFVKHCAHDFLQ